MSALDDLLKQKDERIEALRVEVAELKRVLTDFSEDARRNFIREAFCSFAARYELDVAWELAKKAWELKPDDC